MQPYRNLVQGKSAGVENYYESIAICVIFAIGYLGTPFIVNALLPISRVSGGLANGIMRATNVITRPISKGIDTGVRAGFQRSSKAKE